MPTLGSITKTVRLNPSDLEVIEELMKDGTSWSGAIHKLCDGAKVGPKAETPDYPVEVMKDIDTMAGLFGVSTKDIIEGVGELMNDGSLSVEGGRLVCTLPEWVIRIEDLCRDKGIPVEKVVGMVERW